MHGRFNGWHRTSGYCVYVKNGFVTRYYDLTDEDAKVEELRHPCRIDAFKARIWRRKKKALALEETR